METSTITRKPQNRQGGERRGNTKDRAVRRRFLLNWWGDGETCQCVWCGRTVREVAGTFTDGACHRQHVTADKIEPNEDGPGYIRSNIVPACISCNHARGETPFEVFAARKGVNAAALRAHAAASPKRGFAKK